VTAAGLALLALLAGLPAGALALDVTWSPREPRAGDAVRIDVRGAPAAAEIEGTFAGRVVRFFAAPDGHSALAGIDVEERPGSHVWQVSARIPGGGMLWAQGGVEIRGREFAVQRLSLPPAMVDLDAATERRATAEAATLRALYRIATPERLWQGPFARPVGGQEPGSGFGARRVINGKPRAPHTGIDYSAPRGTPVLAANSGQVALVGDFFFPGRLVVIDHGLGVYTLYFHLDTIDVEQGQRVVRGQPVGSVGATGRATGPHLHFGVHAEGARIDPATLLGLPLAD
jgi:murein DD-endopeptidase MepM/ murein hydrolase activator NlpD